VTLRIATLLHHHKRTALRTNFHAPLPRRLPLIGALSPLERTCAQITAGLPLGFAIAWTADHASQLLCAVL